MAGVELRGAEIGDQLNLARATVTGTLEMDSSAIGGSLFLSDAKLAEVGLQGAEIGNQLSLAMATVTGTLDMEASTIGWSLLLRGAEFADVVLVGGGDRRSTLHGRSNGHGHAQNVFGRDRGEPAPPEREIR